MLNQIKAVIFDMDGTLIDSMWVWKDIDILFLGARGLKLMDTYEKDIEGMSFTETAAYTKKIYHLNESVEELKSIWNEMARHRYEEEVFLKPGAKTFLDYCKACDIKMGIATSNSKELVNIIAKKFHFDEYMDAIVTSCEVSKGKPAPDVYLKAAKRLHVNPKNCLVFEDVVKGIMGGKNAGMKVCCVEDSHSDDDKEEKIKLSDYYIEDYNQVLERESHYVKPISAYL